MNRIQLATLEARIANAADREIFHHHMTRADRLAGEAAELRREAWAVYYAATGVRKGEEYSPYA